MIEMITPLGMDEKTWKHKHKVTLKTYGKSKSWNKGYSAGKEGVNKSENPYLKQLDHDLMRKATLWYIGWEHAAFNNDFRSKRMKKFRKEEKRRKEKEARREEKKAKIAKTRKERYSKNKKKHHKRRHGKR